MDVVEKVGFDSALTYLILKEQAPGGVHGESGWKMSSKTDLTVFKACKQQKASAFCTFYGFCTESACRRSNENMMTVW